MTTYVRTERFGAKQITYTWTKCTIGLLSECGTARMTKAERFAFGAMEAKGETHRDDFAHGTAILEIRR